MWLALSKHMDASMRLLLVDELSLECGKGKFDFPTEKNSEIVTACPRRRGISVTQIKTDLKH